MKVLALTLCLSLIYAAAANPKATECTETDCKNEDGCRCSSSVNPLKEGTAPQLISLTFVEAVTDDLYNQYWDPLLLNRMNPDNNPIGATFYVPHEYTDYERVNQLYNFGFEIGVHSITKNNLQQYWREASEELLTQEFGGQKEIISTFAHIPAEDITGARTPQLQLAGNFSIQAFVNAELLYDSSWPTIGSKPLYPYTLDYLSTEECNVGAACPNEEFKGFWIAPIVDLVSDNFTDCNTLAACDVRGDVEYIADWLYSEIDKVRNSSRVPLNLIVESHWFEKVNTSWTAFNEVLDRLSADGDVYFVSVKQAIEWTKNPVPIEQFETDYPDRFASCNPVTCKLSNTAGAERYMKSCVECPQVYPWLGNPKGLANSKS